MVDGYIVVKYVSALVDDRICFICYSLILSPYLDSIY